MTDIEKFNAEFDFFLSNIETVTVSYAATKEYIEKLQRDLSQVSIYYVRANYLYLIGLSGLNFMMDNCGNFAEIGNEKINNILDLGRNAIKESNKLSSSQEKKIVELLYKVLDIEDEELCSKTMLSCPNPYDIETSIVNSDYLAMLANFVAAICGVENWVDFTLD